MPLIGLWVRSSFPRATFWLLVPIRHRSLQPLRCPERVPRPDPQDATDSRLRSKVLARPVRRCRGPAEPAPAPAANCPAHADPKRTAPIDCLPPFQILLNNDENDVQYVVRTLVSLAGLRIEHAVEVTLEAHETGVALVLTTHRELAEFHAERLLSKGLTATIEPA